MGNSGGVLCDKHLDLGVEDKHLWLNLEMFFPFVVMCPIYIKEKITFTGIDFQLLLVLKTSWNQLFCSKMNFMWHRSYTGLILFLQIEHV